MDRRAAQIVRPRRSRIIRKPSSWLADRLQPVIAMMLGSTQPFTSSNELLESVAHDLRGPIHAIQLASELLRSECAGSDEKTARRIDAIAGAARRADRLLQDLLDVRCLETGRLSIDCEPTSAAMLVREAVESARERAAAVGIDLVEESASGAGEVWADGARMLQVLENLVGNALKFTPRGGRVVVAAAPSDRGVLFRVTDTGRGIAPAALPHVFDRFFKGTADRRGAGLGLAIAKGIVEQHGGTIWVESERGKGASFFVELPRP